MNRLEERTAALEENIFGKIFEVCLKLKMSKSGTSEPLSKEEEEKYLNFVETVLKTWDNSQFDSNKEFDNAVFHLCKATLRMYGRGFRIAKEICPACRGEGFFPQEVIVGHVSRETAIESNGAAYEGEAIYDEKNDACPACGGDGIIETEYDEYLDW